MSRVYLLIFTSNSSTILLVFRNSEVFSSILGRSVTNENYISINLEEDSIFREIKNYDFLEIKSENSNINLNDSKKSLT